VRAHLHFRNRRRREHSRAVRKPDDGAAVRALFDSRSSLIVQSRGVVSHPTGFADRDVDVPIVPTLLIATRGTPTALLVGKGGSISDL
jgi:hypothetical protein